MEEYQKFIIRGRWLSKKIIYFKKEKCIQMKRPSTLEL